MARPGGLRRRAQCGVCGRPHPLVPLRGPRHRPHRGERPRGRRQARAGECRAPGRQPDPFHPGRHARLLRPSALPDHRHARRSGAVDRRHPRQPRRHRRPGRQAGEGDRHPRRSPPGRRADRGIRSVAGPARVPGRGRRTRAHRRAPRARLDLSDARGRAPRAHLRRPGGDRHRSRRGARPRDGGMGAQAPRPIRTLHHQTGPRHRGTCARRRLRDPRPTSSGRASHDAGRHLPVGSEHRSHPADRPHRGLPSRRPTRAVAGGQLRPDDAVPPPHQRPTPTGRCGSRSRGSTCGATRTERRTSSTTAAPGVSRRASGSVLRKRASAGRCSVSPPEPPRRPVRPILDG